MGTLRVILFVSSNCVHCPKAEKVAEKVMPDYYQHGLTFRKARTRGGEGKQLARQFDIRGVPAMVFLDDGGNEVRRITGVPSEQNLRKDIEKQLGLRKKSFLGRLFGG
ncbi:MAG: thioredoxin fold domain-containing protein [Candidatus Aenigmarchaeota archaeon]|nr:thioredoxin fold domain-containing protein [Candidatus Aenigmarchaeota archaeon]